MRFLVVAVAAALAIPAVSTASTANAATTTTSEAFDAHGSVNQVWVVGARPHQTLAPVNSGGTVVDTRHADAQGSKIFRDVVAGHGYRVRSTSGPAYASGPLTVTNPDQNPSQAFYASQHIGDGYQYLRT